MRRITEIGDKLLQRINIHFCVKLGWTLDDTFLSLRVVYGRRCLHRKTVKGWYDAFTNGRTRILDQFRAHKWRTGCSQTNIDNVRRLVDGDRSITLDRLAHDSGLPRSTVHRILTKDLLLKRRSVHFVPALLNANHWRQRFEASQSMLRIIRRHPGFLKRIVTMDETWVYMYDPAMKIQCSQWLRTGDPRPSIPKRALAVGKCMMVTFCDWKGMIYREFVRGRTVDTTLFLQILGRFEGALRRSRPRQRRYLHMDNASPHTSRDTQLHLLFTGMRTITHPPYSPDLAPSDFWLYPRIKKGLKGRRFATLDKLEEAVDVKIAGIASHEYQDCFTHKWPMRWVRCVFRDGDYFEGLS